MHKPVLRPMPPELEPKAPAMSLQNGATYIITNAKSGTALDLSAGDNHSIIGWPRHGAPNQRWNLIWAEHGWHIRSAASGLFLGLAGVLADGTRLIASPAPCLWHIWADAVHPGTFRVFVPDTHYDWDLWNYGDRAPGTPVTLWWNWEGAHQCWKFDKVN